MPRRHGSLTVFELKSELAPGTRYPKPTLVPWKKFVYFEQDAYQSSQGMTKQQVEDDRIRVKVRYTDGFKPGQIVLYHGEYYKIWRTWIDGRRYIELYCNRFDWNGDIDG